MYILIVMLCGMQHISTPVPDCTPWSGNIGVTRWCTTTHAVSRTALAPVATAVLSITLHTLCNTCITLFFVSPPWTPESTVVVLTRLPTRICVLWMQASTTDIVEASGARVGHHCTCSQPCRPGPCGHRSIVHHTSHTLQHLHHTLSCVSLLDT